MRRLGWSNSNYGQVLMVFDVLLGTHSDPCRVALDSGTAMGDKALSSAGVAAHVTRPLVAAWRFRVRWRRRRGKAS